MEILFIQLLNGLVYGMLLFLIAAGLSLIFGLMNVVSLAHGTFFMLGAFIAYAIFNETHSFWLALILAPIPVTIVGVLIEIVFLRPLYRRGHLDQILLTFGFTFIGLDAVQSIWGRDILTLPTPQALRGALLLGSVIYPEYRLFLIALGGALALALWLTLDRSRLGAMVRAGVDDASMAAGLGGNIPALFTGVFGGGAALAALGGVVAGPILGVYVGLDSDIMMPAFIVIVVGGMGSLRGAFVGSLLIGEADTFGKAYFPNISLFFIYLVMAAVLLLRPQGLFGIKRTLAAAPHSTARPAPGVTPRMRLLGALALAALIVYPWFVTDYSRSLMAEIFIFAIFAMSLDLLLGYTGLASLGHAAFFGVGAYLVIITGAMFGLNAWLGVVLGVLAAAAAAGLIGYFCVRLSGVPFLMVTLAFSQLAYSIALKWRSVTGGTDGLGLPVKPSLFGMSLFDAKVMYYLMLACFVVCFVALRRIVRSPLGLAFVGIRENEERMRAIGYPTRSYKLASFIIAGSFAGFAGGLYAIYNGFISPDAMYWSSSGDVLIMVMLGGTGTLLGPSIGAAIVLLLKNIVSAYSTHWPLIIGVVFIACVRYFPGGLWGALSRPRVRASK